MEHIIKQLGVDEHIEHHQVQEHSKEFITQIEFTVGSEYLTTIMSEPTKGQTFILGAEERIAECRLKFLKMMLNSYRELDYVERVSTPIKEEE